MVLDAKDAPTLTLDAQSQAGFVAWYNRLPQEPNLVRIFDRKGFYTVHGDNALFIARTYYRTTAVIKYLGGPPPSTPGGGSTTPGPSPATTPTTAPASGRKTPPTSQKVGLPSVSLNRTLYEGVLRGLLLEGGQHSVELWEGYGANWTMIKSASPGRLAAFEDELFNGAAGTEAGAEVPVVAAVAMAVKEGQRTVGVAFLDAASRQLGACEFLDDDHFCTLEALLVQLGCREVVTPRPPEGSGKQTPGATPAATPGEGGGSLGTQMPGVAPGGPDARRLRDVMARVGVLSSERPSKVYSTKNLEQDLGRLLKSESVEQHRDVLERPLACAALAALLSFSELMSDSTGLGKFKLALYDPGRFMRLDAAAQRALNVFPSRGDANSSFSLLGLMGRTRTPMGKRRLKAWLKQPLVEAGPIRERLDLVEALAGDLGLREGLRDGLRGLPDVERLARLLEAQRISLAQLCQLYRASAALPRLEDALRCHEGPHAALLASRYADPLARAHNEDHLTKFEMLLEASLDLDRVPEEYIISAAYDPRLKALSDTKQEVEGEIAALAAAAAKDLGLVLDKTLKLEWHKVANSKTRCLRITQKEEKVVRSKLNSGRYIVLETRKDGTKFTNRALKDAAERLNGVGAKYEALQKDLVAQVVAVAHTFVEVWEGVASLLAELDVLASFAELSTSDPTRPYVRPEILEADEGEIVLLGCRHPCVEAQEGVEFVANDCCLVKGESWFTIVTGPNMGGKSTFIRQVGAVVLMAQVGCFVPCTSARIAPRDAIFARVGAGDCQLRGVSTFMAEMLETAAILKGATSRSLVIIDELGRGTSTYDGFGLAWAISEYLMHMIGAPSLFATHFHELTDISGPGGVANKHVETRIDPVTGKLTMLYNIKDGACDQSFGIHVAESANFPAAVVEAAKVKLQELEAGSHLSAATAGAAAGGGAGATAAAAGFKRKAPDSAAGGAVDAMDVDGPAAAAGSDVRQQDSDQGSGKQQQQQQEAAAAQRAKRFMSEFAALPLSQLGAVEGAEAALQLLQGLEEDAADNPLLLNLLQA